MGIEKIKQVTKKFFYNITPPFYVVALVAGVLSGLALILTPYIDTQANQYKTALLHDNLRLGELSKKLEEYNVEINMQRQIIKTEFALSKSAGRALDNAERAKIAAIIAREADKHNIDPVLVVSLIYVESSFNRKALSNKNAKGLMQLLPDTAEYIKRKSRKDVDDAKNLFDVETNIKLGIAYLDYLITKTKGNVEYALIAYNMGPSNLNKALKRNKLPKTYSNKVLAEYNRLVKEVNAISVAIK